MKKKILWAVLIIAIGFVGYQTYIFTLAEEDNIQPIYLVPKNAAFVFETERPIDTWDEISASNIWKHFQTNTYFKNLTESLDDLDKTFQEQKQIIDFIGERDLLISVHVYKPKKFDFLYVADLQKLAKLNFLKKAIAKLTGDSYKITKRVYKSHEILELYDKKSRETLHITFIKNQLVASFTHVLVEQSIDQYLNPIIGRDVNFIEVRKQTDTDGFFNMYTQHTYLKEFLNCFTNSSNLKILERNKDALFYSGFDVSLIEGTIIQAIGFTNINTNTETYLKALQKSGKAKRSVPKIAPRNTSLYLSFAFDDFTEFHENLEELQQKNPIIFKEYTDGVTYIENKLDINIKKNVYSWIGDEIALLHFNTELSKNKKDIAAVIKADDIDDATENLDYILSKIKENTPLKFKQINYRGFPINFFDLKGFFKLLAGDMFAKMEKPYFTIIDDFVIFSDSPNTLKEIINNHLIEYTLESSDAFSDFNYQFDKKSSLFAYVNTPNSYQELVNLSDRKTRQELVKNKPYISCFSQIGLQLIATDDMFESNITTSFETPENITLNSNKEIALKKELLQKLNPQKDSTVTITRETIFNLAPIHPSDLSANKYKEYFENGKLQFEVELNNGVKHGDYNSFYPNGKTKIKGRFKKDKQYGTWKAYHQQNGNVIFKKQF